MISSYALCWRMVPRSSGTPREVRMASWPWLGLGLGLG